MNKTQRPRGAATAKRLISLILVPALIGAVLGWFLFPKELRVTRLFEDGSGTLSDGRSFCIAGELCEREVAK